MSAYTKVLIAIDLYGSPEQVLARAAETIDKSDASIHILSVSPGPAYIPTSYPPYSGGDPTFDWESLREASLERIVSLAETTGLSRASVIVDDGRATDTILKQAQLLKADLIILGSHGRHGIGLLLGSTANGVLHRAECDVLAVRLTPEDNAT